jgi:protein TonB
MARYTLLVLINIVLTLSSCSKKYYQAGVTTQAPALSPAAELLTSYIWKETSVLAYKPKGSDTLTYNITRQFENTDKDDLTIFRQDGTFLFEEGQTKFTPQSSEKYYTGTWQLEDGQRMLTLNTNNSTDVYEIIRLDTTGLTLKLAVKNEENTYYYLLSYTAIAKSAFGQQKELLAKNKVYTAVDQQPQYPGGHAALLQLIRKKQHYPAEARKKGIEGKVVVQFVVSEAGKPGEFQVTGSLGHGCDEAVLQTCKAMPDWQPGLLNGKPVPVLVTLPVVFKL